MKQTRRKELKTNELSIYLQEIRESAIRNSNYIIGGVVVVVLILIIGLTIQRNRLKAEAERWREYREIEVALSKGDADVQTRAANLADQTAGDLRLGPRARSLYGDVLREKAMSISPVANNPERDQLLEKAKDQYQRIVQEYSKQTDTVIQARMKLASVAESLYVDGKSDQLEVARQQYQEVIKVPNSAFHDEAQKKLDTLAERTQKLQIVASRPAESAPAGATTRPTSIKLTPGTASPTKPAAPAVKIQPPATAPAAK